MTSAFIYIAVAVLLFLIGIGGCLRHRQVVAKILSLNVCGAGVFLLMVSVAQTPTFSSDGTQPPDAVLHALVLTGIVVAVSATALGLAIVRQLQTGASATCDDATPEAGPDPAARGDR